MIKIQNSPSESNKRNSREVCELTGKAHFNICRDIRVINSVRVASDKEEIERSYYIDSKGEERVQYLLTEDDSNELLGKYYPAAIPLLSRFYHHNQIKSELVVNYQDEIAVIKELLRMKEQSLIDLPKLDAYDRFMNSDSLTSIDAMAKECGTNRYWLCLVLRDRNFMFKNQSLPIDKYVREGLFKVEENEPWPNGLGSSDRMYFTPKGVDYFSVLIPEWVSDHDENYINVPALSELKNKLIIS